MVHAHYCMLVDIGMDILYALMTTTALLGSPPRPPPLNNRPQLPLPTLLPLQLVVADDRVWRPFYDECYTFIRGQVRHASFHRQVQL